MLGKNSFEGVGFIMCMQIQEKILSLSIILSKLPNLAAVDVLAMIPGWAVCGGSNGYDLKIWRGFNRISRGGISGLCGLGGLGGGGLHWRACND